MRKIDTSNITNSVGMPFQAGTFDHIQAAYQEVIAALANAAIGRAADVTNGYVLYGCVNSGTPSAMNVSAGAIYYAGEIFLVDAFPLTVANTAVASMAITFNNVNADPTLFTDNSTHNVHQIRKIVFTDAASGSGMFDFNKLINVTPSLSNQIIASASGTVTINFRSDQTIFITAFSGNMTIAFDMTNAIPGAVVRLKFVFGAGQTVTLNTPSGALLVHDSGTLGSAASNTNVMYFLFAGNNGTYNEISYTIKQV